METPRLHMIIPSSGTAAGIADFSLQPTAKMIAIEELYLHCDLSHLLDVEFYINSVKIPKSVEKLSAVNNQLRLFGTPFPIKSWHHNNTFIIRIHHNLSATAVAATLKLFAIGTIDPCTSGIRDDEQKTPFTLCSNITLSNQNELDEYLLSILQTTPQPIWNATFKYKANAFWFDLNPLCNAWITGFKVYGVPPTVTTEIVSRGKILPVNTKLSTIPTSERVYIRVQAPSSSPIQLEVMLSPIENKMQIS